MNVSAVLDARALAQAVAHVDEAPAVARERAVLGQRERRVLGVHDLQRERVIGLRERDAVDRGDRVGGVLARRCASSASSSLLGREPAHLLGVQRDGRDHDRVLGEVAAEGRGTDAGCPQQLRRAERIRRHDHEIGRHEGGLARAQVFDRDTGHAVALALDPAHQRQVAQLEALARGGCPGSMSGPSTKSVPPQRMEPSGCGSPETGRVLDAVALGQLAGELLRQQRADRRADGGVGEGGAPARAAGPSRGSISSSHSASGMNGIFSLKAGDGVAHVQCAP